MNLLNSCCCCLWDAQFFLRMAYVMVCEYSALSPVRLFLLLLLVVHNFLLELPSRCFCPVRGSFYSPRDSYLELLLFLRVTC
jgi:hypothetical protein